MRVLITGGAGYVGSHVCFALREAGHHPVVFDNLLRGHQQVVDRLEVPFIEGDLCQPGDIERAMRHGDFDAVIHAAAVNHAGESMRDPGLYYSINVSGTQRLLDAMRAVACRRLIYASSAAVYGAPSSTPVSEDAPKAPLSPYGHTKLACENMIRSYASAYRLEALCLRYFSVAGAQPEAGLGERREREIHLIPNLLKAAAGELRSAVIFGSDYDSTDGTCVRDFMHVLDLARLHLLALERLDGLGAATLNVGSGQGRSVLDVIDAVERVTGQNLDVTRAPRRAGDAPRLVASTTRATKLLGFSAEHSLDDMVSSAWSFQRARPTPRGRPPS